MVNDGVAAVMFGSMLGLVLNSISSVPESQRGAAAVALFSGRAPEVLVLAGIGGALHFLGAPIIHWANGQGRSGFSSLFGLRLGIPLGAIVVGAGVGFLTFVTNGGLNGGMSVEQPLITGSLVGLGSGILLGWVLDATVWAYKSESADASRARSIAAVTAPLFHLDPSRGTILFGAQGRF